MSGGKSNQTQITMKTVQIQLYKFNELSEDAKRKAIEWFIGRDNSFYYDELIDSVKAAIELFNLKTGREWTDIRTGHIDDCILELKGARAYKWLVNNYWSDLFKPKYLKSVDLGFARVPRCFKMIERKNHKGQVYTQIYSRLKTSNDSVLTGVCYDDDVLRPVYDFLSAPDKHTTVEDVFKGIEDAVSKTFREVEEWVNSDEFAIDGIEANSYDFTEDGKLY